jgi:hypothetical protein
MLAHKRCLLVNNVHGFKLVFMIRLFEWYQKVSVSSAYGPPPFLFLLFAAWAAAAYSVRGLGTV